MNEDLEKKVDQLERVIENLIYRLERNGVLK